MIATPSSRATIAAGKKRHVLQIPPCFLKSRHFLDKRAGLWFPVCSGTANERRGDAEGERTGFPPRGLKSVSEHQRFAIEALGGIDHQARRPATRVSGAFMAGICKNHVLAAKARKGAA